MGSCFSKCNFQDRFVLALTSKNESYFYNRVITEPAIGL